MGNDDVIEEEFDLTEVGSKKVKFERKDVIFMVLVVVLVAGASFGLGRLSALGGDGAEIKFTNILGATSTPEGGAAIITASSELKPAEKGESSPSVSGIAPGGQYVASRTGKKFHLPWCPGALQIKEENKIWFATKADAEKAGYTPAANCKGI